MKEKPPDSPRDATVDDELNETTRESMERLGTADLDEEVDADATDPDDADSSPGQNSDWLPQ